MIRDGLSRILEAIRQTSPMHEPDPDVDSYIRRVFPLGIMQQLSGTDAPGKASGPRIQESTIIIEGQFLELRKNRRLPTIRFRDLRQLTSAPYYELRYFFASDASRVFLALSVAGIDEDTPVERARIAEELRLMFLAHVLVAPIFLDNLRTDSVVPTLDLDGGRVNGEDLIVFFATYDGHRLPPEEELVSHLMLALATLQWAVAVEVRDGEGDSGSFISFRSLLRVVTGRPSDTIDIENSAAYYPVWYGTNRVPRCDPMGEIVGYGEERDDCMHVGSCIITVPRSHTFGSVGSGWWVRLLKGTDDRLQVGSIVQAQNFEQFIAEMRAHVVTQASDERQALVYVHGYNVSFEYAAMRAGQIGYDLKVPTTAFFSWPSKGTIGGYLADEATIEASEPHIRDFLRAIAGRIGEVRVNLIVHSMGNRGVIRAINELVAKNDGIRFGQIFLAAPDIDAEVFGRLALDYPLVSRRTTLYVSSKDVPVDVSSRLHDYPRVGRSPPHTVIDRIDTVDVGDIDPSILGHGYVAEAEPVLYDMTLAMSDIHPSQRPRLQRRVNHDDKEYWLLSP